MKHQWTVFEPEIRWRIWGGHPTHRRSLSGWLSLAAAVALMTWAGSDLWAQWHQNQLTNEKYFDVQDEIQRKSSEAQQPTDPGIDIESVALDRNTRRGLNQAVTRLNIPWPSVFETLERSTPADVALIRIEPDGNGLISIEAEATDLDKVMSYANGLENQGVFGSISFRRHITNDRDPNRPARLTFSIKLREALR